MKRRAWIGIVAVLFLTGIGNIYVRDSATVSQALIVEAWVREYCQLHDTYPRYEAIETRFPHLYPNREWHYWPNETGSRATFQYPMTLPLPSAPGHWKLSEFLPVIYSYAVNHPCRDVLPVETPAP